MGIFKIARRGFPAPLCTPVTRCDQVGAVDLTRYGWRVRAAGLNLGKNCHSRVSGNPTFEKFVARSWMPAFAGMTNRGLFHDIRLAEPIPVIGHGDPAVRGDLGMDGMPFVRRYREH